MRDARDNSILSAGGHHDAVLTNVDDSSHGAISKNPEMLDIESANKVKSAADSRFTPKPASDSLQFSKMSHKAKNAIKRVQAVVRSKKFDMVTYLMKRFEVMRLQFEN